LQLVDAVNDADTEGEHSRRQIALQGFRYGVEACGGHLDLIACDFHTMEKHGEGREICCGVLLDWKPKKPLPA
jgi:hypothetical protein